MLTYPSGDAALPNQDVGMWQVFKIIAFYGFLCSALGVGLRESDTKNNILATDDDDESS